MRPRPVTSLGALVAALLLAFTGLVADPTGVAAQTNPYQRGPAPTAVTGTVDGSFAVATTNVGRQSNWAGGTIYYPTDTSQGTFGAVVVSPGFLSGQVSWTGRRIASHGFVVFTIDTNSGFDFPGSRATQIDAALNYLTTQSTVASRIDRNRLGVMGHSMGGGGTLELARTRPTLKAIVPLQPWDLFQSFNTVRVPTMIIGAQNDTIASTASHSEPFYESVPAGTEKAYVELSGQSHLVGFVGGNATQSRMAIAWLKRWLDNDTRYSSIACTRPSGVSDFRSTCPV